MSVNKIKLNINKLKSNNMVNIPISMDFDYTGRDELIKTEFIDIKKEESINPITDYEKSRYYPMNYNSSVSDKLIIELYFKTGNKYSDIGFINDDLRFRKNNFVKSHIRFDYFDSPNITNQNFLFSNIVYCGVLDEMINSNNMVGYPINFILYNPMTFPNKASEGYFLYYYKDEVGIDLTKELYVRCTFNNAKDGKSYKLMGDSTQEDLTNTLNKIHMKYLLLYDNGRYYYKMINNLNNNVLEGQTTKIKLYEIDVI